MEAPKTDSVEQRNNPVRLLRELLGVVLAEGHYKPLTNFLFARGMVVPDDVLRLSDADFGQLVQDLLDDSDVNSCLHSSLYAAIANFYFQAFNPAGSFGVVGDVRSEVAGSFGHTADEIADA